MNTTHCDNHRAAKQVVMTFMALPVAALLVLAYSVVQQQDVAMERAAHGQYCSEVSIWRAETARGIPAIDRTGHPDYRGIADQQCAGIRPASLTEASPRQLATN